MIANRSMPSSTVIPVLPYPDIAAAIDWLTGAFGFSLRLQIATHRAQLNAGDGAIVLTHNPSFKETSPTGYSVMVRVSDVDAHHDRAIQYQARILSPPCDHPYGERQYTRGRSGGSHLDVLAVHRRRRSPRLGRNSRRALDQRFTPPSGAFGAHRQAQACPPAASTHPPGGA